MQVPAGQAPVPLLARSLEAVRQRHAAYLATVTARHAMEAAALRGVQVCSSALAPARAHPCPRSCCRGALATPRRWPARARPRSRSRPSSRRSCTSNGRVDCGCIPPVECKTPTLPYRTTLLVFAPFFSLRRVNHVCAPRRGWRSGSSALRRARLPAMRDTTPQLTALCHCAAGSAWRPRTARRRVARSRKPVAAAAQRRRARRSGAGSPPVRQTLTCQTGRRPARRRPPLSSAPRPRRTTTSRSMASSSTRFTAGSASRSTSLPWPAATGCVRARARACLPLACLTPSPLSSP